MDIDCEGWSAILQIFPDMEFTKECDEQPELQKYLVGAINTNSVGLENPLESAACPQLDSDFSKLVLLNGLPICDEKKAGRLVQLLTKIAKKNNLTLNEEDIELNFTGEGEEKMTTGQACLTLATDEQAKIIAGTFNGHKLDKKHTFSSCTFPDYEKKMAVGDAQNQSASSKKDQYLELHDHMVETKKDQYAIQVNKKIFIGALQGMTKVLWNIDDSEREKEIDKVFESDKQFLWSPNGTYMVLIKSDKVEFISGHNMEPILSIQQPKVETVIFSPCEKYIVLYMPKSNTPYEVWNFQTHEKIREFEQNIGEGADAFKWSYDSKFIARYTQKKQQNEEGEEDDENVKTYITVYELPSMAMCIDSEGNKTSIFVDGLQEFTWAPHKNVLVYTSFPKGDTVFPRVSFQEMPTRRLLHSHSVKDSVELTMYHHPQGNYLAVLNKYMEKKKEKFSVEIFETKDMKANQIANQKIIVEREVVNFYGVVWEPHQAKVAIHTQSRKILAHGEVNFSNDLLRNIVDIFQIKSSPTQGFQIKEIGSLPSEKVQEVYFSGVGNILCTIDLEAQTRSILNFYLISKNSHEGQTTSVAQDNSKHKLQKNQSQIQALAAVDDTYEFQKVAKHEVRERKYLCHWDQSGRFFVIQGRKATNFDKSAKSIQFYNILGELLDKIENLPMLDQVQLRPRALNILNANQTKQLKKDYKKKYGKMIDEERANEKRVQDDIIKDKKKKIRDDFLENFFIPLRREYESNIEQYKSLFPIKESDMATQPQEQIDIYQYMEEVSSRKLDIHQ